MDLVLCLLRFGEGVVRFGEGVLRFGEEELRFGEGEPRFSFSDSYPFSYILSFESKV